MDWFPLLLAIIAAMVIVLVIVANRAFQRDPSGGVTERERDRLRRELSADEEMLACIKLLQVDISSPQVACLTHRRIIMRYPEAATKTIIELRHVTGITTGRYRSFHNDGAAALKTIDGTKYVLACKHISTGKRFFALLSDLLDRQSSAAALGGAGTELDKLSDLVARGIIGQADFERAKGLLLGKPMSKIQESAQLLESLYALRKEGVLSESEFNMKKWDVLSR
jgi:hypothetical protein